MIEYALLVMLGFCVAGLLALLIAPTIWNRAVRLTTKRLDATLPMSLSDIEADKDLLRAAYAIQIRRLEAGLTKARDKSAGQLVDISKLQMAIGEMRDRVAELEKQLEERRNAANVFERTIRKRFPEMETALGAAKAALDERAYEIGDLNNKLRRKEEALALLQRSSSLQQAEIRRLRESLEGNSADRTGRFRKRPAQWSLDEFRSEYDRLSLELSKMREQLALAHERETGQVAVLKAELQNLAEQIMSSAMREKQAAAQRASETLPPAAPRDSAPSPRRQPPAERLTAPQPWPRYSEKVGGKPVDAARPAAAPRSEPAPLQPAEPKKPETQAKPEAAPPRPVDVRRPAITDEASSMNTSSTNTRPEAAALKTLLDRAAAVVQNKPGPDGPAAAMPSPAPVRVSPAVAVTSAAAHAPAEAGRNEAPASAEQAEAGANPAEPNIDRMLREIFEGRGSGAPEAASPPPSAGTANAEAAKPSPAEEKPTAEAEGGEGKPQSLTDRLRVV
jgi:hypothetical protein